MASVCEDRVNAIAGPTKACTSLALAGDKVIVGSADFSVTIYDINASMKATFNKTLHGHTNAVTALCSASTGHFYSAGADGQVRQYCSETLECKDLKTILLS